MSSLDFYLDWREIQPTNKEFRDVSSEQMAKAGFIFDVAQQLRFAKDIYQHAQQFGNVNCATKSFTPLGHHIFLRVKEAAKTEGEWDMLERETIGIKWGLEDDAKRNLERVFDHSWIYDCPICSGLDSLVAELDFHPHDVVTDRCACVKCGFAVSKGAAVVARTVSRRGALASLELLARGGEGRRGFGRTARRPHKKPARKSGPDRV